jgi:hypothetical protein
MVAHTAFLTVARFLGAGASRRNGALNDQDPVDTVEAGHTGPDIDELVD